MIKFILPSFKISIERWKWNNEYKIYVSNMGNFKNELKEIIPIKIANNSGYSVIKTKDGLKSAHRIVMLTWKPVSNAENLTVDHLDHNKRNNRIENLEWTTKQENWARAAADIYSDCESWELWQNHKIKSGSTVFDNADEVIAWLQKNKGLNQSIADMNKVKRKLHKACVEGVLYHGRRWYYA